MNSASHSTVSASAAMAVLIAERCAEERLKCSARTMLTRTMSSSGYASDRAPCATVWPWKWALCASARLQERVSSEPPISQASSARQTQPARVTGRLASTSRPTMAGGAKSRKQKSAIEGLGTGASRTTSYHPQMPLPRPAIAEEAAKSSQAGRKRLWCLRAYSTQETAAARAAALSPKSPMIRASFSEPQPNAAPVA